MFLLVVLFLKLIVFEVTKLACRDVQKLTQNIISQLRYEANRINVVFQFESLIDSNYTLSIQTDPFEIAVTLFIFHFDSC